MLLMTGFNNKQWKKDIRKNLPDFMEDNIFHLGTLKKVEKRLKKLRNGLIIIDEMDVGNKQGSVLHTLLKKSGLWEINQIKERNVRFVFISASGYNEFKEFDMWTEKHYKKIKMEIPESYTGIKEFRRKGLYRENFPVNDRKSFLRWVYEDIQLEYSDEDDYRIHEIRINPKKKTLIPIIEEECKRLRIICKIHTSNNELNYEDEYDKKGRPTLIQELKKEKRHMIVVLFELHYRNVLYSEIVPFIGARKGRYSKTQSMDTIAQNQRMCGYVIGKYIGKKVRTI